MTDDSNDRNTRKRSINFRSSTSTSPYKQWGVDSELLSKLHPQVRCSATLSSKYRSNNKSPTTSVRCITSLGRNCGSRHHEEEQISFYLASLQIATSCMGKLQDIYQHGSVSLQNGLMKVSRLPFMPFSLQPSSSSSQDTP